MPAQPVTIVLPFSTSASGYKWDMEAAYHFVLAAVMTAAVKGAKKRNAMMPILD